MDYKRAIDHIYELATRPEGITNAKGQCTRIERDCIAKMVLRGVLVKNKPNGPGTITRWNPVAPSPNRTFYDTIIADVKKAQTERHKVKPAAAPKSARQGVKEAAPPAQSQEDRSGVIFQGNKVITSGGYYFELGDIYAVVNGRALGVHHSKQCGDFFSARLTPAEAAFLVGIIRERLENEYNNEQAR